MCRCNWSIARANLWVALHHGCLKAAPDVGYVLAMGKAGSPFAYFAVLKTHYTTEIFPDPGKPQKMPDMGDRFTRHHNFAS